MPRVCYYQKYERGQKHGIGRFRDYQLFSPQSQRLPSRPFQSSANMITVTLILAALTLVTAADDAADRN